MIVTVEYRPHPVPAYATPRAREYAFATHLTPAGWWVSYLNLANAIGGTARGCCSSLSSISPLYTADSYEAGDDAPWCLPWHRIRLDNGQERSREAATFAQERCSFADEMYANEGGLFDAPGEAAQSRRFDIGRKVAELKAAGLWPSFTA